VANDRFKKLENPGQAPKKNETVPSAEQPTRRIEMSGQTPLPTRKNPTIRSRGNPIIRPDRVPNRPTAQTTAQTSSQQELLQKRIALETARLNTRLRHDHSTVASNKQSAMLKIFFGIIGFIFALFLIFSGGGTRYYYGDYYRRSAPLYYREYRDYNRSYRNNRGYWNYRDIARSQKRFFKDR